MENIYISFFLFCSAFIVTLQRETCYLTKTSLPWFQTSACHVMCTKSGEYENTSGVRI